MDGIDERLVNGDSRAFWAGVAEGRLVLQRCRSCGHVQFPPRFQCATCWSDELEEIESGGGGTVEAVTIVRRAPTAQFRGKVPYAVAAIALDEGPRMITDVVGDDALETRAGDRVAVAFAGEAEGPLLPRFRRAAR